jgi:soluble lytic murein transglycosylase
VNNDILPESHPVVHNFRIGYFPRQIWLSELSGILFAAAVLICFSVLGITTLVKERNIRKNTGTISKLDTERILLSREIRRMGEQDMIMSSLEEFGRGRLSRQTVKLLVNLVYKNSRTYGYDPLLVLAVIHVESYFRTDAHGRFRSGNSSGALGLMQIKFETALEVAEDLNIAIEKPEDVFDPEINIALGVGYLTQCISRFNSLKLGILAYNQGPDVIRQSISGKRPMSEDYYRKVLQSYFRLKESGEKNREYQG